MPKEKKITQKDTSLAELITTFDELKEEINSKFYQGLLDPVVFTLEPNKGNTNYLGFFTCGSPWNLKGTTRKFHQITINSDKLNCKLIDVVSTICHELVHLYCYQKKIKDTSRNGKWHNQNFKEQAENHGLISAKSESIGWSDTRLKPEVIKWLKSLPKWKQWEKTLRLYYDQIAPIKRVATKSHRIQYVCPDCGMKITCTKEQNLICGNCTEDTNSLTYLVRIN